MYTTKITVNLSGRFPPDLVYAKQGDVAARQVEVTFLDNGVVYTIPQGTTARIRVTKPDRTYVFNDCTISGNVVTAPLTAQTLAAAGEALADIALYQGENELLSCSVFRLIIEKRPGSDEAAESSDEFGALDTLIQQAGTSIPAAAEAAEAANTAAGAANSAASAATTAAGEAGTATTVANQAATAATTAAGTANTAANAANQVVENLEEKQTEFDTWFDHIQGQLGDDAAGNLQNQIDSIKYFYVIEKTLYIPNTAASVSEGVLTLGTTTAPTE